MSNELLKMEETSADVEPEVTAEQTEVEDCPVDEIDALRAEIESLQAKEAALTEKLALANEKGLVAQADKCRMLLLKVVRLRMQKQEELRRAEALKLAAELDALAAEITAEIDPPVEEPEEEEEDILLQEKAAEGKRILAKSKRTKLAAKVIGFVGVFACLIGALVYMILTQVDTLNLPFEWLYLAAVGGGAVLFLLISLIIGGVGNAQKRTADRIEAEVAIETAVREELAREAELAAMPVFTYEGGTETDFSIEGLNAAAEAYAVEKQLPKKKKTKKLAGIEIPTEIPDVLKQNVHKIVPVAAVCTAVVAGLALSSSRKRAAAERRAAAARREFFKWLS